MEQPKQSLKPAEDHSANASLPACLKYEKLWLADKMGAVSVVEKSHELFNQKLGSVFHKEAAVSAVAQDCCAEHIIVFKRQAEHHCLYLSDCCIC